LKRIHLSTENEMKIRVTTTLIAGQLGIQSYGASRRRGLRRALLETLLIADTGASFFTSSQITSYKVIRAEV